MTVRGACDWGEGKSMQANGGEMQGRGLRCRGCLLKESGVKDRF